MVALDMRALSRVLWVNAEDGVAMIEAGITGVELKKALELFSVTMGMEPDSMELSTLGGPLGFVLLLLLANRPQPNGYLLNFGHIACAVHLTMSPQVYVLWKHTAKTSLARMDRNKSQRDEAGAVRQHRRCSAIGS